MLSEFAFLWLHVHIVISIVIVNEFIDFPLNESQGCIDETGKFMEISNRTLKGNFLQKIFKLKLTALSQRDISNLQPNLPTYPNKTEKTYQLPK